MKRNKMKRHLQCVPYFTHTQTQTWKIHVLPAKTHCLKSVYHGFHSLAVTPDALQIFSFSQGKKGSTNIKCCIPVLLSDRSTSLISVPEFWWLPLQRMTGWGTASRGDGQQWWRLQAQSMPSRLAWQETVRGAAPPSTLCSCPHWVPLC